MSGTPLSPETLQAALTQAQAQIDALTRERNTLLVLREGDRVAYESREAALAAARDEAEKANQAKSDFLSNMSHELRTPLNAILGFAQVLKNSRTSPLNERQNTQVEHILKAGHHLLSLINEVLDLSRVESGRMALTLSTVSARTVIEESLELAQPLAERVGVTLQDQSQLMLLPMIHADAARARQALLNLLSNAIKYNRPQGTVTVSAQAVGQQLVITVQDNGVGIPRSRHRELFQPFNRLGYNHTAIEGSGIGLVLTRRLMELMGGDIGFQSEEGLGSRFWLRFPVAAQTQAVHSQPTPTQTPYPTAAIAKAQTILYIEDNPANLALLEEVFHEQADWQLISAVDAESGLALARIRQPDLMLIDLNLPKMSGQEAAEHCKNDPQLRRIPLVALTANAMFQHKKSYSPFSAYLTKPVDIPHLLATINQLLNHNPIAGG